MVTLRFLVPAIALSYTILTNALNVYAVNTTLLIIQMIHVCAQQLNSWCVHIYHGTVAIYISPSMHMKKLKALRAGVIRVVNC